MVNEILVTLDLKNDGVPRIVASYILMEDEWEPIKNYLENEEMEIILRDEELCNEKLIIDYSTLKVVENYNKKYINAFKTLYKNHFFTYDLLMLIREKMFQPKKEKTMQEIFAEDDTNDLDYYINSKKNTPEFSNLDDTKVKELIMETRKTLNLFRSNNGDQ